MKVPTLRNNQEYRRVYDQGQKIHTPYFTAFFLKTGTGEERVGITVTRKVGSAVVRNRCKRRLREVVRKNRSERDGSAADGVGYDLVLNVKSALIGAEFNDIEKVYRGALERLNNLLNTEKGK